jgi:hypothetical protein
VNVSVGLGPNSTNGPESVSSELASCTVIWKALLSQALCSQLATFQETFCSGAVLAVVLEESLIGIAGSW